MSNNTSKEASKHKYLRTSFWADPSNHFWETLKYSEKQKEYYREWVRNIVASHRNTATI